MRDDQDLDDLLSDWGREESGREEQASREGILHAGLALQSRRRRSRRLLFSGLAILLLGLSFLGGRMSVSASFTAPEGMAPRPFESSDKRALEEPPGRADDLPLALRYELEAYEAQGPARRDAYARAAEAWLEEESDVLESLRCLEKLEASGEELAESDPLRNHWLYRALQRDMN